MTYDNELILVDSTVFKDEIGQDVKNESYSTILCAVKSVSRNEYYAAANTGLKPSVIFIVHSFEYNGQLKVKFENQNYKVIRSYTLNSEEIELTCEKVRTDA